MNDFCPARLHILTIETAQSSRNIVLDSSCYTIGRSPKNKIKILEGEVSWYHANIIREKGTKTQKWQYRIYDGSINGKKSTNSLIINNKYCSSHLLRSKDSICLGTNVKIIYYLLSRRAFQFLHQLENKSKLKPASLGVQTINYKKTVPVLRM